MATILQLRRGTTTQHNTFTGAVGEVTVDTTKDTVVVHDGVLAGGVALATEAYVNAQLATADNSDEITEGSTNLYFTNTRARGAFSASTGISITDGAISTSITQYTDASARAAISITDAGGDGSLAYNNSTGVITFTGPSASDVRAHFSAGTGIAITNGSVAVDSTIATKTYADNAATTAVANVIDSSPDALNTLNELAAALNDDANFSTTITTSIGTKLNSSAVSAFGLTLVDDADAATARTTLGLGTAATTAATAYATSAQGTTADNALPAANVSVFGGTLIDDVDAAAARTTLGLGTVATTAATAYATSAQGTKADDALPSADFNTTFDTRLGTKSTTNLTEGTNLYFTTARARDSISAGTGITITSGAIATTITQYTDALARASISAGTGLTYNSTTGVITNSITQYTDALARASVSVTDSGGDGSLAYNNSTGVITFTGPSASDVRAHFSAGTGITITDGAVAVDSTIATKTYADNAATTAVANVIDTAPAALNTLNELAAALGDDANFSTTITTSIGTKLNSSAVSAFGLTLVDDASAAAARTTLGLGTAATTASSAYATSAQGTKADNALPAANVSAFGLTLIDDASAGAARNTLGLGTAATQNSTKFVSSDDVTVLGISIIESATAADVRTTLGLGTAATTAATAYATAAQGTLATNALPAASYTAADVLDKIKTVDGAGSGLDADLLDGQSSAHFRINVYSAAGTLLN